MLPLLLSRTPSRPGVFFMTLNVQPAFPDSRRLPRYRPPAVAGLFCFLMPGIEHALSSFTRQSTICRRTVALRCASQSADPPWRRPSRRGFSLPRKRSRCRTTDTSRSTDGENVAREKGPGRKAASGPHRFRWRGDKRQDPLRRFRTAERAMAMERPRPMSRYEKALLPHQATQPQQGRRPAWDRLLAQSGISGEG